MRTFVMGDIHGRYNALKQCLTRAQFDYEYDKLIFLGDVADRGRDVPECVEELMKIKNLVFIKGNHDEWMIRWFDNGESPYIWLLQGGDLTTEAYQRNNNLYEKHRDFLLNKPVLYYVEDEKLFVHGGYDWARPIDDQKEEPVYYWDRKLAEHAFILDKKGEVFPDFKEIYVGHTPTIRLNVPDNDRPVKAANVWLLDQGAAFGGKLTILDVETKEYWQSENTQVL